MRKILLTFFLTITAAFFLTGSVEAQILDKTIERTYKVAEESVQITETVVSNVTNSQFLIPSGSEEVFTIFNPIIDDEDAQAKIDNSLPTIKVVDGNGQNLKYTTEIDGQHVLIKVARPQNIVFGQPYSITATYSSFALSNRTGAVTDIYIPSFSEKFQFKDETTTRRYNTTIVIPKSFGENNLVVPESNIEDRGANWQIKFTQEQLTGTVSWIQMGTNQYYKFKIVQPYPQTSPLPLFYNTFDITLPRNVVGGLINQQVHFANISPEPDVVTTDKDGNIIAQFRVPANEAGEIVVEGFATLSKNTEIDIENSGVLSDIATNITEDYTLPAIFWESDNSEIITAANEIKSDKTNVYDIVASTYGYVVDKIDYSNVKRFGINQRQGALATFKGGAAVCMEYSDLFIALSRAQGIPARAAFGYGYDARSTNGEQTPHQWAEVYIPKLDAWIAIDTTWGESGPAVIGGDLNHFYKYVASIDPQTPPPVSVAYFGSTPNIQDESFTIEAMKEIASDVQTRSPEQLLVQYPERDSLERGLSNIYQSISLGIRSADTAFHSAIVSTFGVSAQTATILKAIAYLTPIVLIVGVALYTSNQRKNKVDLDKI